MDNPTTIRRHLSLQIVNRCLVVYRRFAIYLTPIIRAVVIAVLFRFLGLAEPPKLFVGLVASPADLVYLL
jgi:hypothetical protein